MEDFGRTSLWKKTLAERKGRDADKKIRNRLQAQFLDFRENAGLLADEIKISFPTLTVHGITHLDTL